MNEPTKKEDINRKYGETTLKQCGWCEYAMGSHRYNYCIEGKCNLGESYGNRVTWNMACRFLGASKNEIESIIGSHKYTIKENKEGIVRHNGYIKKLNELKTKAVVRPALPSDRKSKHFNIKDEVCVYFDNKWWFGKVVNGYRHQDGCVSYDLEGYDKKGIGCGLAVPIVMLKKEYDWFKKNPEQYKVWCEKAYRDDFNGEKIEVAPI